MSTKKTTQQFAQELLDKHSLTLQSEYLGAHKLITFSCVNGHTNTGAATNVLQRGYKCKECLHGRTILPKIQWTEKELEKLKELINQATSTEDIAKYFNTTASAINNVCAKYEISKSSSIRTQAKLAEILQSQGRQLISSTDNTSHAAITTLCSKGHVTTQTATNVIYKDTGCPECTFIEGVSKAEKELREFIEQSYSGWIVYNDRKLLAGKELDIILPDLGLAFEFNGTYWHQEEKVGSKYHLDKTEQAEKEGFHLIHIYDYFWTMKKDIIKSRILSLLGRSKKVYARNTKCKEISFNEASSFLEANHLQGGCNSSVNLGLFLNQELVAVMTFSRPRFTNKYDYELTRYANKLGTTVVGGASKLFKRRPAGSIVSYADRSFSQGNLYRQLGFTEVSRSVPGYAYYNRHTRLSRYQTQKHKLADLFDNYSDELSEKEILKLNGYYRVYDSGNLVLEYAG